ncbi:enolase-binding protein [Drosophila tropicalis]|uniref:enolase-binding protein n=1 Tax=Drosophila tropicalis TaxID=46794 RepID=UPI0035ABB58A
MLFRLLLIICLWLGSTCGGYVEHPNFCIETEPLLLADIGQHVVIPSEKSLNCQIIATTLTSNEKASFIDTMCADHGSLTVKQDHHHYLKLHNGELSGRGSQDDICENEAKSVLAWVPYQMVLEHYARELNPKERLTYIAKATNVEREKTELCHFRHTDLVNKVVDGLFTCVVMIFGDNFYGVEDNINVLVELEPLMYQLRNITYMPWRNTTNSYKMNLGSSVLKNPSHERKPIYGSINYSFVEKLRLNVSSIYQVDENLAKLPLLLEHRGSVLELDANGIGGLQVDEKAYFGRSMDPLSEVRVQVIGQWVDQYREFSGDIYEYYGHGLRRYKQALSQAKLTLVRVDNTEPVFEAPESSNLAKASLFREHIGSSHSKLMVNGSHSNFTEWEQAVDDDSAEESSGFYGWFVVICLLVALAIILSVFAIVRSQSKRLQERQKYEVANQHAQQP